MGNNRINFLLYFLLALLWSGSFIGIQITVFNCPAVFSAMMRVLIALFFLTLFFLFAKKQMIAPFSDNWRLWIAGVLTQGIPFVLLFYGEKTVEPALASILNGTVSIWALIFGVLIFRDISQLTINKIMGLIVGIFGILLIFSPMLHNSHAHSSLLGTIAITGMAMSYAIGALYNQHIIAKKVRSGFQARVFQQHCSSFVFLLLISLTFEHWPAAAIVFSPKVFAAFLYLGLFSTAIAWIIYFHLLREWDAVRASSVTYIVPILAIFWDYLFLHLKPTSTEIFGTIAILAGVILIQWQRGTLRKI